MFKNGSLPNASIVLLSEAATPTLRLRPSLGANPPDRAPSADPLPLPLPMTTPKIPSPPRISRVNGYQTANNPLASSRNRQWVPIAAEVAIAQHLHLPAHIQMLGVCHPHPGLTNQRSFNMLIWTLAKILWLIQETGFCHLHNTPNNSHSQLLMLPLSQILKLFSKL